MCKILCKVEMFNTVLNLQNGCLLCEIRHAVTIGIDLAGILGDAWRAPKVGWYQMGYRYERGVPSQPTRGSGGSIVHELRPSGVPVRAPAKNGFWSILKAIERSFLYLYDKIVLHSKFWGRNLFTSLTL